MLRNVLLVDDSDVDLLFTSIVLDRAGIATQGHAFETGADALAYLKGDAAADVDAILLDINMPVMSGFDFLDRYDPLWRAGVVRGVVVMLTSSPDPLDRQRALAYACVRDYLVKPLDVAALHSLADRLRRSSERHHGH